jgi:hypothetical protein
VADHAQLSPYRRCGELARRTAADGDAASAVDRCRCSARRSRRAMRLLRARRADQRRREHNNKRSADERGERPKRRAT